MNHEESIALADRILRDAGWTPARVLVAVGGAQIANVEERFAFANLVCGHPPPGSRMTFAAKELTKIPQAMAASLGLDPADYPDEHHEAAAWLVEHAKAPLPPPEAPAQPENKLSLDSLQFHREESHAPIPESEAQPEAAEGAQGAVGGGDDAPAEERPGDVGGADAGPAGGENALERALLHADDGPDEQGDPVEDADYEAEFEEVAEPALEGADASLPELEPPSLGEEILEEGQAEAQPPEQNRFYGLDDLDRRRSLRIGDVIRYALEHTPVMDEPEAMRLRELRSYVSGVAEGSVTRDAADQSMREELDTLEALAATERRWDARRDAKVAYLVAATREQVEGFVVENDWP